MGCNCRKTRPLGSNQQRSTPAQVREAQAQAKANDAKPMKGQTQRFQSRLESDAAAIRARRI